MKKTRILLAIALCLMMLFSACTAKQNPSGQGANNPGETQEAGTTEKKTVSVTISVTCQTAVNAENKTALELYPDGVVLKDAQITVDQGMSVLEATEKTDLVLGISDSAYGKYVYSINSLASGDCGDMSGWLFRVNGEIAQVSCSEYQLKDGDAVEWIYTVDGWEDVQAL